MSRDEVTGADIFLPAPARRPSLIWVAQLAIVIACAFVLKLYYSTATPDELRWILAPTTALVELLSGRDFYFESLTGYMSSDRTFVIALPCAGVNFLITAFLLLTLRHLWRERYQSATWRWLPVAAVTAYVSTLVANTVRICLALEMQRRSVDVSWLTDNQLHRVEGIVVYFGFLLLLYLVVERAETQKPGRLVFPLVVYYATTLGIPLLNGSYRQGAPFWEHFIYVLALPLVILLATVTLDRIYKMCKASV